MPTDAPTRTITADDLRAMRKADSLVFRYYRDEATIECITRPAGTSYDDERRLTIPVEGGIESQSATDHDGHSRGITFRNGFAMQQAAQYNAVMRSILKVLRPGDRIVLGFHPDAFSNGYTKTAGGTTEADSSGPGMSYGRLHVDALYLHVHRPVKDKPDTRMSFVADVSVAPDNSARMVTP